MNQGYNNLIKSINHLKILHLVFRKRSFYRFPKEKNDYELYKENLDSLKDTFNKLSLFNQLYNQSNRQMILADVVEFLILGRGYYSIGTKKGKSNTKKLFIKGILHLVNLLMCYDSLTTNKSKRKLYLEKLANKIPSIRNEELYEDLRAFDSSIGIPDSSAPKKLASYFDKFLPKTAGGLWHELLVYVFMLRNDLGYIVPLLLHQKIYSLNDHLVPPDFLLISFDKRIYGIEVGIKKEIQSGAFSLKTAIPTATIDTINSRTSDRCPACKKWIGICPFVINQYADTDIGIDNITVSCLNDCTIFSKEQIKTGICKYTKFSRSRADTLPYTHHKFSDGKHYHYKCILDRVSTSMRRKIIDSEDNVAIKTHYPYYNGLEELMKK